MNAVPVEVSSRSAGRSKYNHHMAKRVSRPPAMIPTSSAVSPPSPVAVWMASDAARDRFPQHDDREQPVPLGDVAAMPRRSPRGLGPHGDQELRGRAEGRHRQPPAGRED